MPLPTNLTTNEVKDSGGIENEFNRLAALDRKVIFARNGEVPNSPHRITVSHSEIGAGISARRRSVVRVDRVDVGGMDADKPVSFSAYCVVDIPIGNITNYDTAKNVLANLMSLLATTGAGTTVLFDCTGYGAAALINGSL